ncbi:PTS sugar transporter subunit IIB [Fictibacillus phosphorivorans]|uniref:PTS sugar transporter subunit IIB n=1 Tax=Fictibacillus phosphorivorans TaxID=1221500 RepID=UPI00203DF3FA|nr:hypothetical protein [Fictibacillus phosphorivorans]MCM3775596.1 hypothetical protein [Fictibacillus phosphorivorans]
MIVVCEAGISTSLLVKKLNELAQENEETFNIHSKSTEEGLDYVKKEPVDAVLLVPQIHHKEKEYKEVTNGKVLKVSVNDYNNMNAYSIFEQLNEAI